MDRLPTPDDDDWDPRAPEMGLPGWGAALVVSPLVGIIVMLVLAMLGVVPSNLPHL